MPAMHHNEGTPMYEERKKTMLKNRGHNLGKKYKKRRPNGPPITLKRLLIAIQGSCGVFSQIARVLKVTPQAVKYALARDGWEEAKEAYIEERDNLVDVAELRVVQLMKQTKDLKTALNAARLVLETKGGWSKKSIKIVEGGSNPIKISHGVDDRLVDIESMNLSIEVRKEMLASIERGETPSALVETELEDSVEVSQASPQQQGSALMIGTSQDDDEEGKILIVKRRKRTIRIRRRVQG